MSYRITVCDNDNGCTVFDGDYRFVFVTLTVRNCSSERLASVLENLRWGFDEFLQHALIKKAFKGAFKFLEISHNECGIRSLEYHPHIHMVAAVKKSYFISKDFVSRDTLMSIWRDCCHLDYDPLVDAREILFGDFINHYFLHQHEEL